MYLKFKTNTHGCYDFFSFSFFFFLRKFLAMKLVSVSLLQITYYYRVTQRNHCTKDSTKQ